jgi:hypothetical protein
VLVAAVALPGGVVSRCRSCGAEIVWAMHEFTRRRMPLDAEPIEAGNVALEDGVARVLRPNSPYQGPRYVSHFATCPNAKEHRR